MARQVWSRNRCGRCGNVIKEAVTDAVGLIPETERMRRVRGTDNCEQEPSLYEFVVTGTDVVTRLADRGVRSGTVAFESGRYRLVATLPPSVEPATSVTDLRTTYDVELIETRTEQEPATVPDAFLLTDEVTAAQREAVQAAYEAGFFEWPRDSTSEEVATALGISQSAFAQRLIRIAATDYRYDRPTAGGRSEIDSQQSVSEPRNERSSRPTAGGCDSVIPPTSNPGTRRSPDCC